MNQKHVKVLILLFIVIVGVDYWSKNIAVDLPSHSITDNTSLLPKDGNRVQIDTTARDLTKKECKLLIKNYRKMAGKEGQISVYKPDSEGQNSPWCYENIGDGGVKFNDSLFQ